MVKELFVLFIILIVIIYLSFANPERLVADINSDVYAYSANGVNGVNGTTIKSDTDGKLDRSSKPRKKITFDPEVSERIYNKKTGNVGPENLIPINDI